MTVAGGATDMQARMFAQKLSESMKRQFIVENRPGGNYIPGYGSAAKAAPDGYTLLSAAAAFTIVPALNPALPDPVKAGRLRAIAVTSATRSSVLPQLLLLPRAVFLATTSPRGTVGSHQPTHLPLS